MQSATLRDHPNVSHHSGAVIGVLLWSARVARSSNDVHGPTFRSDNGLLATKAALSIAKFNLILVVNSNCRLHFAAIALFPMLQVCHAVTLP